ncbi:MAG: signal recognition particle-docking protein FtsY [Clostridia bacterium]
MNFIQRLKEGLSKTKKAFTEKIDALINSFKKVDQEFFDELEEILIESDIGVETTAKIISKLTKEVKTANISEPEKIRDMLKAQILDILSGSRNVKLKALDVNHDNRLNIILIVGVNGTGKTTSIGKLTKYLLDKGKNVILAAGDTFRAAATEQLEEWAHRCGVEIVKHSSGSDPAAVVYDAIHAALNRKFDVLICDTAGRLHTKSNLMEELKKIKRVISKEAPDAIIETLLVIDAGSGQNSLVQAHAFNECVDLDGLILTKLDGTAKGGMIISICSELDVPVKFIGIGEKADDLREFDPDGYTEALFDK